MDSRNFIILLAFISFLWGCEESNSHDSGGHQNLEEGDEPVQRPTPTPTPIPKDEMCPARDKISPKDPVANAANLIFSVAESEVDLCSIEGFVIGYHEELKITLTSESLFLIRNIPSGTHDVLILGKSMEYPKKKVGALLNDMKTLADTTKDIGQLNLDSLRTLQGKVESTLPITDGIVNIIGTPYSFPIDAEGQYTTSAIPAGKINLRYTATGHYDGFQYGIQTSQQESVSLHLIKLIPANNTDIAAAFFINDDAQTVYTKSLNIGIIAPKGATQMKIGESLQSLEEQVWRPLMTYITYEATKQGDRTIYLEFGHNGEALLGKNKNVKIDLFAIDQVPFSPYAEVTVGTAENPEIGWTLANITIPPTATEMIFSLDPNYAVESWSNVSKDFEYQPAEFQNQCGPGTLYFKFRDTDLIESIEGTISVVVPCMFLTHPVALTTCHEGNQVYDRVNDSCTIELASYECNWDNIETAFGNTQAISDLRTQMKTDGYIVDQCGVDGLGKNSVHLYCLAEQSGGDCVDLNDLTTNSPVVNVRKISEN